MYTSLECGANMIDRGLAVARAERCSFEQDISLRQTQPLANIVWCGLPMWRGHSCPRLRRETIIEQRLYIYSIGVRNPTRSPRCHAGDPPCDTPVAQIAVLRLEQAKQRPVDVAKAK